MVRAFNHQISMQKSRSFHFRKMFEIPGKHIQGLFDKDHDEGSDHSDHKVYSKSFESARYTCDNQLETQPIGFALNINNDHIQEAAARMPPKPPTGIIFLFTFLSQDCA